MNISQVIRVLLAVMTLTSCQVVMAGEDSTLRRWTDNTGRFSATAVLVSVDPIGRQITLQLSDGRSVTLPLRRLSEADRAFVSHGAADDPVDEPLRIAGLDWYDDPDDARKLARGGAGPADDKPILCFRVLGDLEGFM